MKRRTVAGLGGIGFAVLTVLSLVIANTPGGSYTVSDVKAYVASGHRLAVVLATYLMLLGIVGLICLLVGLHDLVGSGAEDRPGVRRVFLGTGFTAAAALAVGWCIVFSAHMVYAFASGGDRFSLSTAETYAIVEIGFSVLFGVGAELLAVAMLILAAAGSGLPTWLRWITGIAGILGLASIAFFPSFALPIWSLAVGVWLLASGRRGSRAQPANSASV